MAGVIRRKICHALDLGKRREGLASQSPRCLPSLRTHAEEQALATGRLIFDARKRMHAVHVYLGYCEIQ